jgi:DUF2934 family protein
MSTKTLACGQLEEDGDTWFLMRSNGILLLDAAISDNSIEHKTVSVAGTLGFPPSSPGIQKLIVDRIATHDAIAKRAYEIFQSGQNGSSTDHWLQAERELLNM